jgi:hypothetical protein
MILTGSSLFTVGTGFLIGGVTMLVFAAQKEKGLSDFTVPDQEDERRSDLRAGRSLNGAGIAFTAIGAVLGLAGSIVVAIGAGRRKARLRHDGVRDRRQRRRAEKVRTGAAPGGLEVRF